MRFPTSTFALILGLAFSVPAFSTTFVMVSDQDLTDQATAVVGVRVLSKDFSPVLGQPATDYLVQVQEILKGEVPGSAVIVRVPGGIGPGSIGLKIFGAPNFKVGDRAVLFLKAKGDGTYRILHLMLGAFHEVFHQGERLAVRNLGEAVEVQLPGREPESRSSSPRNLEKFSRWIEDRGRGRVRPADYFVTLSPEEVQSISDGFTLFTASDGRNMRWFSFDTGGREDWRHHSGGQPGLTTQQVQNGIRDGVNAWNGVSDANINYFFAGSTGASGGLTNFDSVNTFLFENPNNNNTFDSPFSCPGGGTVAIGGPWFTNSTRAWNGQLYHEIVGGDVVTNMGVGCFFNGSSNKQAAASELFGHELGHTLGLGHSSENSGEPNFVLRDALMFFSVHDDGRGARLNSDDRAAARALYGTGGGGGSPPTAPTNLGAQALSANSVQLTWLDNSNNENNFKVEQSLNGIDFAEVEVLGAEVEEHTVTDLAPQTGYTFRVQASNVSGDSAYSNEASATTLPDLPAAPGNLEASPLSGSTILLTWDDNSSNEVDFRIERSSATGDFAEVAAAPAGSEQMTVASLGSDTPYTFRVRARGSSGSSPYSNEDSATTLGATGPCLAGLETLCLLNDRFEVDVKWRNQHNPGENGSGQAIAFTGNDLTGAFWFFSAANTELIVKLLDGQPVNGFFWTFYGALTNVEYWITVRDTVTGVTETYHNPPSEICGLGDVTSFAGGPATSGAKSPQAAATKSGWLSLPAAAGGGELDSMEGAGVSGTCVAGPTTLCLLDNQFEVEVEWDNQRIPGDTGVGGVLSDLTTSETGYFWFFDPDNIELVVKILDGRAITGNYWVFYGGLSDVIYHITVTDTLSGNSKSYMNEAFNICGEADVNAL